MPCRSCWGVMAAVASSGNTARHRLNRSGDRQLDRAFAVIVRTRMSFDPTTNDYVTRSRASGKIKPRHLPLHVRPAADHHGLTEPLEELFWLDVPRQIGGSPAQNLILLLHQRLRFFSSRISADSAAAGPGPPESLRSSMASLARSKSQQNPGQSPLCEAAAMQKRQLGVPVVALDPQLASSRGTARRPSLEVQSAGI